MYNMFGIFSEIWNALAFDDDDKQQFFTKSIQNKNHSSDDSNQVINISVDSIGITVNFLPFRIYKLNAA